MVGVHRVRKVPIIQGVRRLALPTTCHPRTLPGPPVFRLPAPSIFAAESRRSEEAAQGRAAVALRRMSHAYGCAPARVRLPPFLSTLQWAGVALGCAVLISGGTPGPSHPFFRTAATNKLKPRRPRTLSLRPKACLLGIAADLAGRRRRHWAGYMSMHIRRYFYIHTYRLHSQAGLLSLLRAVPQSCACTSAAWRAHPFRSRGRFSSDCPLAGAWAGQVFIRKGLGNITRGFRRRPSCCAIATMSISTTSVDSVNS